ARGRNSAMMRMPRPMPRPWSAAARCSTAVSPWRIERERKNDPGGAMPIKTPVWGIRREGRRWTNEEFDERIYQAPEKIEFVGGIFASERERLTVLGMLLENLGIDDGQLTGLPRMDVLEGMDDASARSVALAVSRWPRPIVA